MMLSRKAYSARLSKMYNVTLFIAFTNQLMRRSCVKTVGAHPYKYRFLEKNVERKSVWWTVKLHVKREM